MDCIRLRFYFLLLNLFWDVWYEALDVAVSLLSLVQKEYATIIPNIRLLNCQTGVTDSHDKKSSSIQLNTIKVLFGGIFMGWCSKCQIYFYRPGHKRVLKRCPQCRKIVNWFACRRATATYSVKEKINI